MTDGLTRLIRYGYQGPPGPAGSGGGGGAEVITNEVLWRPGLPSGNGAVATWEEVYARILSALGQIKIKVDDTYGQCTVSTGEWDCFQKTFFESAHPGSNASAFMRFAAGAKLVDPYGFSALALYKRNGGGPIIEKRSDGRMLFDDATTLYTHSSQDENIIQCTAAQPQLIFLRGSNMYTNVVGPTKGFVKCDNPGGVFLIIVFSVGIGALIFPQMVESANAADYILAIRDSSAAFPAQPFFAGTLLDNPTDRMENTIAYSGLAAAKPTTPVTGPGTLYYETDTPGYSYWDGAAWQALATGGGGGFDGRVDAGTVAAGTYNDYNTGTNNVIEVTGAGAGIFTGFVAPTGGKSKDLIIIGAPGGNIVTLTEENVASAAANRIKLFAFGPGPTNANAWRLTYSPARQRWCATAYIV